MTERSLETRRKPEAQDDGLTSKVWREIKQGTSDFGDGIAAGAKNAWHNPGRSALGLASTVGIGLTLGILQREAGMFRVGSEIVGASLGLSFVGDVATSSSWRRNGVANTLGHLTFDTALMSAAGIGSAKLAGKYFVPRNELKLSQIVEQSPLVAAAEVARVRPVEVAPPVVEPVKPRPNLPLPELTAEQLRERMLDMRKLTQVAVLPKDLAAIRNEISTHGKDPAPVLAELMRNNRVLGIGEKHASPNPHRDFAATVMPQLGEAGATHLAIEAYSHHQYMFDRFNAGGEFTKADMQQVRGTVNNQDYRTMLEAAREAGLKVVAVDTKTGHRDTHMAKKIGEILDANPDNKVVFWVGSHHLVRKYAYDTLAVELLRKKYTVPTVVDSIQDRRYMGMPGPAFVAASDLTAPVIVPTALAPTLANLPRNGTINPHGLYDYVLIHPDPKNARL